MSDPVGIKVIETIDVNERTSCYALGTLVDQDGDPVPAAALTALELVALYNDTPDGIINSRSAVNVLNASGGTYHATTGAWRFDFVAADSPIVDTTLADGDRETHYAHFRATWGTGKGLEWLVRIRVRALRYAP